MRIAPEEIAELACKLDELDLSVPRRALLSSMMMVASDEPQDFASINIRRSYTAGKAGR